MKVITVASLMAGVGRSTIAFHGAFCLPRSCLLSDDQRVAEWVDRREDAGPSVHLMNSVNAALSDVAQYGFEHVIIDARTTEKNLYWSLLRSDLAIIPTPPTRQGFDRAREMAELVTSLGADFKIVVTMVRALADAEQAMMRLTAVEEDPQAVTYSSFMRKAAELGKSIYEWSPDCLAAVEMTDLWSSVMFKLHAPASLDTLRRKSTRLAALQNPFD